MKNFRFIWAFMTVLLGSIPITAQESSELLFKVVDAQSKEPIAYVTIQFQKSGSGIVGNVDGDFRIPSKFQELEDQLIISSIGYTTKTVKLLNLSFSVIHVIELNPKVEALDEVVIKGNTKVKVEDPVSVVRNAINSIPQNYPTQDFSKVGYFRDYQLINKRYYNLNEAIVESFDAGFDTDVMLSPNESALYFYRENREFLRDSSLLIPYDNEKKYIKNTTLSGQGGNELGILNVHNPIRNYSHLSFSFVYVFKKKFIDNHEFYSIKTVYLNDDVLYEITFRAKPELTKSSHSITGKIFIAKSNYAIHKFTYTVKESEAIIPLFEVEIQYKPKGDKMYLNYITFNNQFVIDEGFKFDLETVVYDADEKAFFVSFNNDVDPKTLDNRDFRFKFQNKKLVTKAVELQDSKSVKVLIEDWSIPPSLLISSSSKQEKQVIEISDEEDSITIRAKSVLPDIDVSQFSYRIKNIYDITKRKLYKSLEIKGLQFRELFIQDVYTSKAKPTSLKFINKGLPLRESDINAIENLNNYWLNTPLKNANN